VTEYCFTRACAVRTQCPLSKLVVLVDGFCASIIAMTEYNHAFEQSSNAHHDELCSWGPTVVRTSICL